MDIVVQQEQPPPALATASLNANNKIRTSSKHKGIVYPDISVLRCFLGVNTNFRTLTHDKMGHKQIDYLICERSIKRAYIRKGLKAWDKGYNALTKSLRNATWSAK